MAALKLFLVVHEEPALVNEAPPEGATYVPRPSHLPLCSGPPSLSVAYVLFVLGLIGFFLERERKSKLNDLSLFFSFFFFLFLLV